MRTRLPPAALVLILAACTGDDGLKVIHEPPAITIFEPAIGTTFFEEQLVTFKAQVTTLDGSDVTDVSHSWVAGEATICESTGVPADGIATCTTSFSDAGAYTITVTAINTRSDRATATVDINVAYNEPPTVQLIAPESGASLQSNDLVIFEALLADAEDEADELTVTVTSSKDGVLGLPAIGTTGGEYSGATNLTGGTHLLTITVTDTAGKTGQDTATVKVNDAPSAPTVQITPDPPGSGAALTATVTAAAVDPEGDAISYRYDWYVDGSLYQSSTVPVVGTGVTQRGQFWEVYVYPYDGAAYGNPGSDAVSVSNSLPVIDSVTIDPNPAYTDDDIVATPVGWYDGEGDPEKYAYAWYINEVLDASATTNTYPASATIKGDTVRVIVTPSDPYGAGAAVSSGTREISNTPPTAPGATITPGSPQPEDNLVCGLGATSYDADGDAITYDYVWYKNGVLTTNTTYTVTSSDTKHGDLWECRITADDGEDTSAYGAASVTVSDVSSPDAPTIDSIDRYTNDDDVDLTGTCEAGCALTFYFSDGTGSWTEKDTCDSDGTFDYVTYVTRGYDTQVYAICKDSAGNNSSASNTVTTQACTPYDTRENTSGYGDSGATAIDEWATLTDAGTTTVTITANALESTDEDWYVISTLDDYAADVSAGRNAYNFDAELTAGSGTYSFWIYKGDPDPTYMECSSTYSSTGYQEFNYYQQDLGEGVHSIPSDNKACSGAGNSTRNQCTDLTEDWYIKVMRNKSASASCDAYTLTITNGL